MIRATVIPRSCFCWLYRASPSSTTKNRINLISVLTIWWCPHVETLLFVGKGCFAMTTVFSWQNSVSLCPASFCIPRPNLPVTPGISWLSTFAFQSPMMKKTSFLVLVLEGLVGLHRTSWLQLLQYQWLGHRLGLLWCWMVCLGNEPKSFFCFWDCTQELHFGLLLTMRAIPFLLRDSCPC